MLQNFVDLIEDLGFIPNGNRIYYTRRSQPPVFISMVDEYVKVRNLKDSCHQWSIRPYAFLQSNELDFQIDPPGPDGRMVSVHPSGKQKQAQNYNKASNNAKRGLVGHYIRKTWFFALLALTHELKYGMWGRPSGSI